VINKPDQLAQWFDESVSKVEREYLNYQPFYPKQHVFGAWADTKIPHGDHVRGTVDVAERRPLPRRTTSSSNRRSRWARS